MTGTVLITSFVDHITFLHLQPILGKTVLALANIDVVKIGMRSANAGVKTGNFDSGSQSFSSYG